MSRAMTTYRARSLKLCLACLLLFLATAVAYAADDNAYRLGPGDKVRVTVYNEADLSGDFEISGQGDVALPLIGQVHVADRTITDVEAIVAQKYAKDYLVNPRVNVEVLNYRPFFILGEVKTPGSYPYVNGMTVLNAVALAGGYTNRANRDRIYIKRGSGPKSSELEGKEETVVLPGDVIRVAERYF